MARQIQSSAISPKLPLKRRLESLSRQLARSLMPLQQTWSSNLRESASPSCCCTSTGKPPQHSALLNKQLVAKRMRNWRCRYAGRAFETAEAVQEGRGVLMVKGLRSMWRQAPPILRTVLQGILHRIIMQVSLGPEAYPCSSQNP